MNAEAIRDLGTCALSDALDRLGLAGQCFGLRAWARGRRRIAGPAFTVRYRPLGAPPGQIGDFIDDVPAGHVVVIDNGGRTDCTVWGGLMTIAAARRGVAGTVIDGAHRDTEAIARLGYGLFSRATHMRTGKDRVTLDAVGAPVRVAGTSVSSGDFVVGDEDGVVVIPADRLAAVVEIAGTICDAEAVIRRRLEAGGRLDRARDEVGYRELQRRRG